MHVVAQQEGMSVGETIFRMCRAASGNGLRVVPEVTMTGKTLMHLDAVTRVLDPRFDPHASVRRHAAEVFQRKMARMGSPSVLFGAAVEVGNLLRGCRRGWTG